MSTNYENPKGIKVGDRVAYSRNFLASVAASPTSPLAHARGEVLGLERFSVHTILARVRWEPGYAGEVPDRINVANLARPQDADWGDGPAPTRRLIR